MIATAIEAAIMLVFVTTLGFWLGVLSNAI